VPPLRVAFLDALAAPRRDGVAAWASLDADLDGAWAAARAAWPGLPDDATGFVRHLAAKLDAEAATLAGVRAADLYLAWACSAGDPAAIAAFLAGPFAAVPAVLGALRCPPALRDELTQRLRAVFLVAAPGGQSPLAAYGGRGELRSYVASIAARTGRRELAREAGRREVPDHEALAEITGDDDPALAYLKEAYREVFAVAVKDALAELTVRERNLLRQHHLDGLTLDELATLYGAHRATVARWLAAARDHVLTATQALVQSRIALDEGEFASMVRLVQTQVQVSLARLLAGDP
jgi:RNA polymerase sigma-70 factor (ECF subfamily)